MTQNLVDHNVGDAEFVEVGGQTASKRWIFNDEPSESAGRRLRRSPPGASGPLEASARSGTDDRPACRLSRLVGRPSDQWTVDDLVGVVGRLGIRLISLMHVGGDGWLKTLDFVPRDLAHLREVLSFGESATASNGAPTRSNNGQARQATPIRQAAPTRRAQAPRRVRPRLTTTF